MLPLRGKAPDGRLVAHGVDDATTDSEIIRRWWSIEPHAGVGIAVPEDIIVVDVDVRNDGDTTLINLERAHGELPETVEAQTGGGGLHIWLRGRGRTTAGHLGQGIDTKSGTGYVAVPPTLHPSGRYYAWRAGCSPGEIEIADAPEWIIQNLALEGGNGTHAPTTAPDIIPEGKRDRTLFEIAASMRRKGLTQEEILPALRAVNDRRCQPPLPEKDLKRISWSVERYAPTAPATETPPTPESEEPSDVQPAFILLRELLARPELLKPPEVVLPRLAWRGRSTLFVAPDKSGKSTLAALGCAAITRGATFLGEACTRGFSVWCGLEEALADAVQRFVTLNADPDRLHVLALQPRDLLQRLDTLLREQAVRLIVVDSLAEYARVTEGAAPEDGDASGWGQVVRPLIALARQHEAGLLMTHHPRRSDGQYRGSGEIAAAVDALYEMTVPPQGEDQNVRRFRGRARWPTEPFSVRWTGTNYLLSGGGELSLDARVLADIQENPGTSRNSLCERLGGRKTAVLAALDQLINRGAVEDQGGHRGRLFPASGQTKMMETYGA